MKKVSILSLLLLNSCTWSFSNISTHGRATDIVDSYPTETNDIKPDTRLSIPLTP